MAEKTETPEVQDASALRDKIRTAILSAPNEDEVLSVFGIEVEVKAPSLEDLLQYRDAQNDDTVMARAIVNNVFVPGTEQRVFDDADIPTLMQQKFSKDMKKMNAAINRVLGGDEVINQAVDTNTKSDSE